MKLSILAECQTEVLRLLTQQVRVLTEAQYSQLARVSQRTGCRRLRQLCEQGWLCQLTALAADIPRIVEPLADWSPRQAEPDFGAIAYQAQARWHDRPVKRRRVYVASDRALRLFALPMRPKLKLAQTTHDLGCTEMYGYCLRRWPLLTKTCFVGEDVFCHERGFGEKVEDAQFRREEKVMALLEYAGSYRRDRVEAFHWHAEAMNTRYLIF